MGEDNERKGKKKRITSKTPIFVSRNIVQRIQVHSPLSMSCVSGRRDNYLVFQSIGVTQREWKGRELAREGKG